MSRNQEKNYEQEECGYWSMNALSLTCTLRFVQHGYFLSSVLLHDHYLFCHIIIVRVLESTQP